MTGRYTLITMSEKGVVSASSYDMKALAEDAESVVLHEMTVAEYKAAEEAFVESEKAASRASRPSASWRTR